jgi:ABC-type nitrate/sulfonate/bicarbonate transport system ATPase subunit
MSFMTAAPDLVLRGVGHTYRSGQSGPVVALTPSDLTIDGGDVVALVGPAGSGKSTLLDIIAGRLLPTEGEVLLGGDPVAGPGRDGDADLLLLDEPFADLAPADRDRLQEDLHAIWRETRKTIVIAARDAADVLPLATRVIVLSPGPGEILQDIHVDFAEHGQPGVLRADPELVRFTAHLRVA